MKKSLMSSAIALFSLQLILLSPSLAVARVVYPELEATLGYNTGRLNWNIAGDLSGNNPDVLSELTWSDLQIIEFGLQGKILVKPSGWWMGGVSRLEINHGEVVAGRNQDSDYDGDQRTREFSRSNNNADQGRTFGMTLGVGPVFEVFSKKLSLAPLLGFSMHQQDLRMNDGYQTLSEEGNAPSGYTNQPPGPFEGLGSSYLAEWTGSWLGLDLACNPAADFVVYGGAEFHLVDFHAEADWNLRSDLAHPVSFVQDAEDAQGVKGRLGVRIGEELLRFNLEFTYQNWRATGGRDTVRFLDGSTATTRLNEAHWENAGGKVGLSWYF